MSHLNLSSCRPGRSTILMTRCVPDPSNRLEARGCHEFDWLIQLCACGAVDFDRHRGVFCGARFGGSRNGRQRLDPAAWLVGSTVAMGTGIWSMHYIGMLAYVLPIPVAYHWPTVLLLLLAAVLASAIALYVVSRERMGAIQALVGSVLMGTGIASMHYIGMEAMRLQAMCHYNSPLVVLSIVSAVLISFIALWIVFHFQDHKAGIDSHRRRRPSRDGRRDSSDAFYTGMAAARFMPSPMQIDTLARCKHLHARYDWDRGRQSRRSWTSAPDLLG